MTASPNVVVRQLQSVGEPAFARFVDGVASTRRSFESLIGPSSVCLVAVRGDDIAALISAHMFESDGIIDATTAIIDGFTWDHEVSPHIPDTLIARLTGALMVRRVARVIMPVTAEDGHALAGLGWECYDEGFGVSWMDDTRRRLLTYENREPALGRRLTAVRILRNDASKVIIYEMPTRPDVTSAAHAQRILSAAEQALDEANASAFLPRAS